jgi:hypothetical protein
MRLQAWCHGPASAIRPSLLTDAIADTRAVSNSRRTRTNR